MIVTTVKAALDFQVEGYSTNGLHERYPLYLVRDGDVIFYIGQSRSPLNRLQEHMGETSRGGLSMLGMLIKAQAPASYEWTYELRKPVECIEYAEEYYRSLFPDAVSLFTDTFRETLDLDEAEIALIYHFKPCLNARGNPNRTPLPERYTFN
jgi:hypothetical protein